MLMAEQVKAERVPFAPALGKMPKTRIAGP
jgi:hypothetical protein